MAKSKPDGYTLLFGANQGLLQKPLVESVPYADQPAGTTPDQPVWSGRVVNISAGGLQLVSEQHLGDAVSSGDVVGVRISFGVGEQNVYADAQFRHTVAEDGKTHLGFQFIGLGLTPEGREALQVIGSKANQYQRELAHPPTHVRN